MAKCPHCGSEKPAVTDRVFRLSCPACGGPRLPAHASFADAAAETVAVRALLRARARAWRARARLRLGGLVLSLMTLAMVLRVTHTHHVRIAPVVFLGIAWTWLFVSYLRRHRHAAWQVRGALEDAHALAGLPSVLTPGRVRIASSITGQPGPEIAETEETDLHADAFADFDRRLAAVQKEGA